MKYIKRKNNKIIFNKQVSELLCELSEFAYETKCFKYWKNEKSNPEITIAEFANCLMITLCFCDLAHIDKIVIRETNEKDMVSLFIETYKITSTLSIDLEKEKLFKILSNLLAISKLLNYTDKELYEYCIKKL